MSRLAALLMFIAWLLYGAMPAVTMPSNFPTRSAAMDGGASMMLHHEHDNAAGTEKSANSHAGNRQPCPHGGKSCATPFCAACLTLLPEIAAGDDSPFVHPHPAARHEPALVFPAPAPLTPPPRIGPVFVPANP